MKHFYSFLLIFSLTGFLISAQQSDSVKTTLSEIVVTANKTETPYYALGSSVSIITSEDISRQNLRTVVDLLRGMPGLTITQQGGPGKLAYVYTRGSNSNHTLVIIDGVKMNDASSPNNAFDFSTLNTNDIERIEIVRGPQSTLYGSEAIAGVINIITKRGTDKPQFNFSGEGGSNNYYRGNLSAQGKSGIISYAITATQNGSDGISASDARFGNTEKDRYTNNSIYSRLGLDLSSTAKLDMIYKFTKMETALDQNEKLGDDPNFNFNIEEQLVKSGLNLSFFEGKWQQQFSTSLVKRFSRSLDLVDQVHPNLSSDGFNKADRIKFDWQNNLRFIENNLITFGIEEETEKTNSSYVSTSDWGPFESIFQEQSIRTTGAYLQDQFSYENALFISAGVRLDNNQKFGSVATYRVAPAYYFNTTGTKLKMSFGTGFKAPSLFYLFDPAFGNPDLQPEKSIGWDAGFEQYFNEGKFSFAFTYFNLKLENMFGFNANFRTVNIAQASSQGFEVVASVFDFNNFSANANYTYTKTKDENKLSADYGNILLRRPKHQASFNINYKLNADMNWNIQFLYVGEREDKDFSTYPAERVVIPDYTLVNLSATYKLFSYLELTGRIENLFDKQYEEVLYYGTLGRSFYLGLNLNL
ncbi:MAG: TonB-dependent receptor [Melioribacteraceae bacterium]